MRLVNRYYFVVITGVLIILITTLVAVLLPDGAERDGGADEIPETSRAAVWTSSETEEPSGTTEAAKRTETAEEQTTLSEDDAEEILKQYSEVETVEETEPETTLSDEENAAAASSAEEASPDSLANSSVITYSYPTSRMPTGNNTIYLTFTLATEPGYTEQLMNIFAEKGIKATFFITVNEYLHNHFIYNTPGIMSRMAAEGHTIGCHGYNHVYTYTLSDDAFVTELNQSKAAISATVGYDYPMNYYTPPYEYLYQRDVYLVQQQGMTYIRQSFAYGDLTPGLSSAQALQALCSGLADGSIYMLHANAANTGAMAAFIDYAIEQGYQFVALGNAPVPLEPEESDTESDEETESESEESSDESRDPEGTEAGSDVGTGSTEAPSSESSTESTAPESSTEPSSATTEPSSETPSSSETEGSAPESSETESSSEETSSSETASETESSTEESSSVEESSESPPPEEPPGDSLE